MFKKILFISLLIISCQLLAIGQSTDKINHRCPSPNKSVYSSVLITTIGDIDYTPCPSRSSIFTGIVDFTNATIVGGGVGITGSGTATFIPVFTGNTAIGNSPNSWDGTKYTWDNTGLTATSKMSFTPGTTVGNALFSVGTVSGAGAFGINLNAQAGGNIFIGNTSPANSGTLNVTQLGTTTLAPLIGQNLQLGSNSGGIHGRVDINGATNTMSVTVDTINWATNVTSLVLNRTNTAGGTTGNQTINKMNGSVNIAAGQSSIVITNSTVLSTSNILALAQTNDATCSVKNAVPTGTTITITMTAACTGETRVAFWVYN